VSAKVLIIESNLLWSVRLQKGLVALGYEAVVDRVLPEGKFDVAIVNLGEQGVDWTERVSQLHARGTRVVAHAGHKEKELHELGRQAGCDVLATNSELTHKLADVVKKALSA